MLARAERVWLMFAEARPVESRPLQNQAEADAIAGPAAFSRTGQMFRNAIIGAKNNPAVTGATTAPQNAFRGAIGHDAAGNVVREMDPLYRGPWGQKNGYQDLIGSFGAQAAFIKPVIRALRYQGQMPTEEQPRMYKPKPWMDPDRGSP